MCPDAARVLDSDPVTAVFLAQKQLDAWTDEGRVQLDGETLALPEEERTIALVPAVRILAVADGSDDPHGLVGKVKTLAQLKELGAEHYFDSVLHGETAYQVDEGFKGVLSPKPAALDAPSAVTLPPDGDAPSSPAQDDAAKLSDLFLKTVK